MKNRFRSLTAMVAAIFCLSLVGASLPANSQEVPSPEPEAEEPNLPFQAWDLHLYLLLAAPQHYGGLVDEGTIGYVGNENAVRNAVANFVPAEDSGPVPENIVYQRVNRSMARLEALKKKLEPRMVELGITRLDANERDNVLVVGQARGQSRRAQVANVLGVEPTSSEVRWVEFDVQNATSRDNDAPPWEGGNRIISNDGGGCSTGFGVHHGRPGELAANPPDAMVTGSHCSNGQPGTHSTQSNGFTTVETIWNAWDNGWDAQIIAGGIGTTNRIYIGCDSVGSITGSHTPTDFDASNLMNEGATSRCWASGIMSSGAADECILVGYDPPTGVRQVCFVWETRPRTFACNVQPGDSGGPVVWHTGSGAYGILAVGIWVAGNCQPGWYHPIRQLLIGNPFYTQQNHVPVSPRFYLNTSSNPGD